jgi:hypothetical protein
MPHSKIRSFLGLPALLCLLLVPSWGQDQKEEPVPKTKVQPAGEANRSINPTNANGNAGTSKDRLFFALPNFLTVENSANAPPMTAAQKFKETARGTFDPVALLWYGAQAGISQARDSDASFGQGMEGYAKRWGARVADGTIENFMTRAIFPSLLHQDPRYYQLGKGGFFKRAGYAVSRIFVTRSDAGTTQFNFSEVFGSATAAGISAVTYRPDESHNLNSALHIWGTQVGWDALSFGLKEFWPDIRRKMHKTH